MCGELLHGQNALVNCICQRLDTVDLNNAVQENIAGLQQYRTELDQYYQAACQLYEQIGTLQDGAERPTSAVSQQDQEEGLPQQPEAQTGSGEDVGVARGGRRVSLSTPGVRVVEPQQPQDQEIERPSRPEPPSAASFYPQVLYPGAFSYPYGYSPRSRSSLADPSPGPAAMYGPPPSHNIGYQQQPSTATVAGEDGSMYPQRPSSPDQANMMLAPPPLPPPFPTLPGIPPPSPYYSFYPPSAGYPPSYHPASAPHGHPAAFQSPTREGEYTISAQPSPYQPRRPSYLSPHRLGWYDPARRHSSLPFVPPAPVPTHQFSAPPSYPPPTLSPYHHPLGPAYRGYGVSPRVVVSSEAERYANLRSPSGVTAASTQVQPPSSPPSVPSENNLNGAQVSSPPSNGSTLCGPRAPPPLQGEVPTPTNTAPPTQPARTTTASTSLAQRSHEAAVAELKQSIATSGASALLAVSGLDPSAREGRGEGVGTESVSSLPLSVPEGSSR